MRLRDLSTAVVLLVQHYGGVFITTNTMLMALRRPIILEVSKAVLVMAWTFISTWRLSLLLPSCKRKKLLIKKETRLPWKEKVGMTLVLYLEPYPLWKP